MKNEFQKKVQKFMDDKYISVFKENGILILYWKEETINFTDSDFKEEALKYIAIVQKENSLKIIVDMRNFFYDLSEEVIAWRKENIISIYNKIKVEKFAFISEKPTINQDNPKNTFTTKSFSSEQEAKKWINS